MEQSELTVKLGDLLLGSEEVKVQKWSWGSEGNIQTMANAKA